MLWAVLIMGMTTYPYVFLLSTESFSKCGKTQIEAARTLGAGAWECFFKIALPITVPAIVAGIALMGMEVINELGAVQLLNIPSISAGIVENWIAENNPAGAISLSLIALIIIMILIAFERLSRAKSRRWTEGIAGVGSPEWELKGIKALSAQLISIIPPLFTFGVPLFWAYSNFDQIANGLTLELFFLSLRSIGLGLIASLLTLLLAIILSVQKRWTKFKWMKRVNFLYGIGYAIPGVVLALGILSFNVKGLYFSPLILLIWGYSVRFIAIPKGGIDAAFERISPNIDEAATSLGSSWHSVFKRIHFPLLKGPLAVGGLLVFIDTLKELPLTFVLRPFDFDTLSVRIFQYAGDERMGEAIIPALIILFLGLIASLVLIPNLEYNLIKDEQKT